MPAPLVELYVETGTNAGTVKPFEPGQQELLLGRNEPGRPSVDLNFEDVGSAQSLLVSRQHVLLRVDDRGVYVKDLGSRNGTAVNGQALTPYCEVPLQVGTRLQLAPPEGPSVLVRERLAQSGWSPATEEVQLWQERYRMLLAEHKQLQESHHALVAKLQGQGEKLQAGAGVDWQRCQGKLVDSLERLTFASQMLADATVDVKVHGYLQRVVSNLNELQALLRLNGT